MKFEAEGSRILELVGGASNVRSLIHCATRLRFELADQSAVNEDALTALPYVLKVIKSGGQYQVVIGPDVHDYCVAIQEIGGLSESSEGAPAAKANPLDTLLKVVSGAFSPLIPLMTGAGMIKALLTLLVTVGVMSDASSTYLVLSAAGNACFYFLPVFLGYTISNQLGANPFVGAGVGAALLDPNFTGLVGGEGLDFLGLPLSVVDYGSTVFPIFIAAPIYALLDKALRKVVPSSLALFMVPLMCLVVIVPFTALVFGPFGIQVGDAVAAGVNWLFASSTFVAGLILGAVYPFLTVLGLHWGFSPITLINLELYGGDVIEGVCVCAVWAQIGIALGCFLKARQGSRLREIAGPTAITGFFAGVTEPILYSLIMERKRLMAVVAIAGAAGGAFNGLIGATLNAYVFHNIISVLTFSYGPMPLCVGGMAISAVVGCVLTMVWGLATEDKANMEPVSDSAPAAPAESGTAVMAALAAPLELTAPVAGTAIPLSEVHDELFASGAMGQGAAIVPEDDMICAPCDGTVTMIFDTKHAVGITTAEGVELLIHIGVDTVKLGGQGFEPQVKVGDVVKAGQPLMQVDRAFVTSKGFCLDTPILVMANKAIAGVKQLVQGSVSQGDSMLLVS